jgi:hypothetical protein
LGIIDLGDDEDDPLFENIDDDKLPVLKNTFSKKNRPNNSKSVAVNSKADKKFDFGSFDDPICSSMYMGDQQFKAKPLGQAKLESKMFE